MSGEEQKQNIFLISGDIQGGKTSYLLKLVDVLKMRDLDVGGFLAPGNFESGERSGFKLHNIKSEVEISMASTEETAAWKKYRRFWFNPEAFIQGREWIQTCLEQEADIVVIDEVGPMELEGSGWFDTLESLISQSGAIQLWSVRENLVSEVMQRWNIPDSQIVHINDVVINQAAELISASTRKQI